MAEFLLVQQEKINKKINKSKYIKIINTIILIENYIIRIY